MKRIIVILLLLSNIFCTGLCSGQASKTQKIREALASHKRTVHIKDGWIRDPYIVKSPDGYFYLTGTTQLSTRKETQEDKYSSGKVGYEVRIWKSRNLIHWKSIKIPFTLKDGIWIKVNPERFKVIPETNWHLWAPEIHFVNGRCIIVHKSPSPVEGSDLSVASGIKPKRPWNNPMGKKIGKRHDPSLFQDNDGTCWLIWGGTSIAPLKPDFYDFAADPISIGPTGKFKNVGYEGCLIRKIQGKYVLFGTAWSTGKGRQGSYNLYYATADKITGPYSERKFAGRFLGHGTPFQDNAGRWWCTAFYNANVPPLSRKGIQTRDLSDNAYTINEQGVTIVPLNIKMEGNDLVIQAADPDYAVQGSDELQKF